MRSFLIAIAIALVTYAAFWVLMGATAADMFIRAFSGHCS